MNRGLSGDGHHRCGMERRQLSELERATMETLSLAGENQKVEYQSERQEMRVACLLSGIHNWIFSLVSS
jgi:hypothetical protein